MRGWAEAFEGRTQAGLRDLRQAVAAAETMDATLIKIFALIALGATLGRQGEVQEALLLLAEQRVLANRTGMAIFDVPARLCEGELRLKLTEPEPETAEACFQDALDIARRQEAKTLELRTAMALSRLWQGRASAPRPMTSSPRSMPGSPRASIPPICSTSRPCSTIWARTRQGCEIGRLCGASFPHSQQSRSITGPGKRRRKLGRMRARQ